MKCQNFCLKNNNYITYLAMLSAAAVICILRVKMLYLLFFFIQHLCVLMYLTSEKHCEKVSKRTT